MVEHRKGLNRTLFWLYTGSGRTPYIFRWMLLAFDVVTIALFLVHPLLSWRDNQASSSGLWLWVDLLIATVITLDFAARLYIERNRLRFFLRLPNLADMLVVATLIAPFFVQNLVFLRVLRAIRIVRAFEFIDRGQTVSRWLHVNADVVSKVVNLIVFVFIMTALVFVNQVPVNDRIHSYLDALYFTVTSLTTTGYGDLVLVGVGGRWLSITIMVLGVTLFLQLVRAIAVGDKVSRRCPQCQLSLHERDAAHCKRCGADLFESRRNAAPGPQGETTMQGQP
jgi:voltage-gated potassium channel